MRYLSSAFLLLLIGFISCTGHKTSSGKTDTKSDRKFVAEFHPFWGGMASCEFERKSGKDNLTFTYTEKQNGFDTTEVKTMEIGKIYGDSIFNAIEKINWLQPISDGNADPKTGLKIAVSYKKGKRTQQLSWERMSGMSDLPMDVQSVLHLLNDLAPEEFKMF